ncbi:MAG: imidazole glycerol phosphate synthase subunit HisH [Desulfovibrio sp.]|nr:imidazole glycerol phosphate synthase subunit HisH [Desulfovibrio sp.]
MLAIVDYGAGNLASVARSLAHLGIPACVTADPSELEASEGIIFPGVGQAAQAMASLRAGGLDRALAALAAAKKPLLGICLGCQILLEHSEENDTRLLGLVRGDCVRFADSLLEEDGSRIAIPHMGWNSLAIRRQSPLLANIASDDEFYFVHSYYVRPDPELVIATTAYGAQFCSVYGYDGFWATQFHPEKSGEAGLLILRNFYNYCRAL